MRRLSKYLPFLLLAIFLGIVGLAYYRIHRERTTLLDDLNRRARVIAKSLAPPSIRAIKKPPNLDEEDLAERLSGQGRTLGILVCKQDGTLIARSASLEEIKTCQDQFVQQALSQKKETLLLTESQEQNFHSLTIPLQENNGPLWGTLTVVHDASYIDKRVNSAITWTTFILALLALFISTLTYFLSRYFFQRSIQKLLTWTKASKEAGEFPPPTASLLKPVTREFEYLMTHLNAARQTAREISETKITAELWTPARLKAHALSHLGNRSLIVVSHREPYMHIKAHGRREVIVPASGLVTAMDPVLRATSGLWIAHGAGDADRETVDRENKVLVPPESPSYTLKRLWLTKEEEQRYYYGFSNEALWPLCLGTHHRPYFEEKDWETYVKVNQKFADAILKECGKKPPLILAQDYHFTLLPQMIRQKRPDAVIGLFWHIPWPTAEAFQVCPWKREIIKGMLGADLIGFHLPSFCNNFLESVNSLFPAKLEDHSAMLLHDQGATVVKPFPISIQPWADREIPSEEELKKKSATCREELNLGNTRLIVSVDRIDYAKGIPERLGAIDRFLEKYPQYREKVSFIQLCAPSRMHIPRYQELTVEIERLTEEINWKHGNNDWKPIVLLKSHHDAQTVYTFLRMAESCIISSLSDGMNLVAKEFVSARKEADGVLILSEFAGVSREFQEALQINPYARADFAEVIRIALEMPLAEQRRRMKRLKAQVTENNVYKWGAELLTEMARVAQLKQRLEESQEKLIQLSS